MEAIFCYPRISKRSCVDFLSFPVRFSVAVCFVKEIVKHNFDSKIVSAGKRCVQPLLGQCRFPNKNIPKSHFWSDFFFPKRSQFSDRLCLSPHPKVIWFLSRNAQISQLLEGSWGGLH